MTIHSDQHSIPGPGEARNITVTDTTQHILISDLFGADWNDGSFFTFEGTVPFHMLASGASDTAVTPGDVTTAGSISATVTDAMCPVYAANTPHRRIFKMSQLYIHVIRSGGSNGQIRIWKSSFIRNN